MLKMLPSWPNILWRSADDIVYSRVLSWKLFKSGGGCFALTLKAWTTDALHGRSGKNFVALRADVFETLVASASPSERGLWATFQVLARISSNFCCISRVHFHSGSLVSSDPIVFKLLTRLYTVLYFLEMIGLKTGTENFCDIFSSWHTIFEIQLH